VSGASRYTSSLEAPAAIPASFLALHAAKQYFGPRFLACPAPFHHQRAEAYSHWLQPQSQRVTCWLITGLLRSMKLVRVTRKAYDATVGHLDSATQHELVLDRDEPAAAATEVWAEASSRERWPGWKSVGSLRKIGRCWRRLSTSASKAVTVAVFHRRWQCLRRFMWRRPGCMSRIQALKDRCQSVSEISSMGESIPQPQSRIRKC
jgi:hypothetical protein